MAMVKLSKGVNPCLDAGASLGIDEACFSIVNMYKRAVTFYSIAQQAYWGKGYKQAELPPDSNTTFVVTTKYPLHMYYVSDYEYCHTSFNFKEHGSYGWNLSEPDICSAIYTLREPVNSYLPIIVAFMAYILLAVTYSTSKFIVRVIKNKLSSDNAPDDLDRLQETDSSTQPVIRTTRTSTRIQSVDAFRGIAILLMIFVNNSGGKYVIFNHSAWYGLTVADLVLPWFAWVMGITITISKRAELRVTTSRMKIVGRTLQRSLILILFGFMINSMHDNSLDTLRIPGVLQLLAVTYFVCATLETIFMKAHSQFGRFTLLRDILDSWPQWLIVLDIVAVHTAINFFLPVPGCPKGYIGPGGFDHVGKYQNCTAGAAGYIDRLVFGNHTYSRTHDSMYDTTMRYDPEGLMNTVSAILIVYLGVQAGKILLMYYKCDHRVLRWLLWAVFTGFAAGFLCNFEREGGILPITKRVMSLSFVLITSSSAFVLFTVLHILIDCKQCWSGAPFIHAGSNSILLYVGHCLTMGLYPFAWNIANPTHASVLSMNLWTCTLWGIIAYVLHKKDIIITV